MKISKLITTKIKLHILSYMIKPPHLEFFFSLSQYLRFGIFQAKQTNILNTPIPLSSFHACISSIELAKQHEILFSLVFRHLKRFTNKN